MLRIATVIGMLGCLALSGARAEAKNPPKISSTVYKAITAYLEADDEQAEAKALAKAIKAVKGKLDVAAHALTTLPPLTKAKKGTHHGIEFTSGGKTFTYSVRLPKGYDGKQRFPVLVLPDHGSVGEEAGISFWEQDKRVDDYVLFRPVIVKHQQDQAVFADTSFWGRDQDIATVMRDALRHLRLHYAVDPERFRMTGLSQAGYYTWYYGVSFPDDFAVLLPESAGGLAVRAAVLHAAENLVQTRVRILHHSGDQITPYADAKLMHKKLEELAAPVELITYTDADYPGTPPAKRHPGPHHLRLKHVFDCAPDATRVVPGTFTRKLRYKQHGHEGRWRLAAPDKPNPPLAVTCSDEDGVLSTDAEGAMYVITPADILSKRKLKVGKKRVKLKADLERLFQEFKRTGDRGRLVAQLVAVPAR